MTSTKNDGISRREFAKKAVLTSAVAAVMPAGLVAQEPGNVPEVNAPAPPVPNADAMKLTEAGKAEADLAYETIIRKYGSRFDDAQKKELQRLVYQQQETLEKLRNFKVNNGDQPATVLKLTGGDR